MEHRQPNSDCQVSTETVRFPGGMSGGRWVGERGGEAARRLNEMRDFSALDPTRGKAPANLI